ncbi:hypothetical protein RDV89_06805 [Nocardioides zeae]|uniref:Mucin-associated surface protein n=1 Tax=Nocardioides imazamoxiresistens TaxID=3231893 RepID=A0ABU3PUB4_9ACTN|nr:hypothetical protein [Nocardioides zeae]MDT9592769.1 hypothetical protein [Nocardioides zeae]
MTLGPALALLAAGVLGGCAELEDAARDTAREAGCQAAQEAVDGVTTRADEAVADLGADPAAAERELTALRDAVDAAASGVSDEVATHLGTAEGALDALSEQAQAAADGTEVDDVAVDAAQSELDGAVEDLTQVC